MKLRMTNNRAPVGARARQSTNSGEIDKETHRIEFPSIRLNHVTMKDIGAGTSTGCFLHRRCNFHFRVRTRTRAGFRFRFRVRFRNFRYESSDCTQMSIGREVFGICTGIRFLRYRARFYVLCIPVRNRDLLFSAFSRQQFHAYASFNNFTPATIPSLFCAY